MSKTDGLPGAGVAIVQPYEVGHMSLFSASPNRSGAPEPATTGLSSGVATIMTHPPDTAMAFSWTGMALVTTPKFTISPAPLCKGGSSQALHMPIFLHGRAADHTIDM